MLPFTSRRASANLSIPARPDRTRPGDRISGRLARGLTGTSALPGSGTTESRFWTVNGITSMTASISRSGRTRLPGTSELSATFACEGRIRRPGFSVWPPAVISTIRSLRAIQSATLASTTCSAFGSSRTKSNAARSAEPFASSGTASRGNLSTPCTLMSSSSPRSHSARAPALSPGAGNTCRINSKESAVTLAKVALETTTVMTECRVMAITAANTAPDSNDVTITAGMPDGCGNGTAIGVWLPHP